MLVDRGDMMFMICACLELDLEKDTSFLKNGNQVEYMKDILSYEIKVNTLKQKFECSDDALVNILEEML